ncbi:hypothetical protein Tco_0852348 [Tanacetum coccineum]
MFYSSQANHVLLHLSETCFHLFKQNMLDSFEAKHDRIMNPQETQQVAARDEKWVARDEKIILDICLRVEGVDFMDVPDDDTTLTFLIDLGYKGPLNRHTNIENVNFPELIWGDVVYQIDHKKKKRSMRENMPYPRFTKIIINHFLKQHKCLTNLNHKHYHTIKDDGIVSRLKFVKIGEDYQEYGLPIPDVMLTDAIKHSESYQMFIKYSTNQIHPKKSKGKAKKKTSGKRRVKKKVTLSFNDNIISDDPDAALVLAKSISQTEATKAEAARQVHATHARIMTEFILESAKKKSGGRILKSIVIQDTPSAPKSKLATSKGKLKGTGGSNEGTGTIPGVPDESTVISSTLSEGTGIKPGVPDEEKDITKKKVILEWGDEQDSEHFDDCNDDVEKDAKDGDADDEGDDHISDTQDVDDEDVETESDEDDIYKYKIYMRKDEDVEMKDAEVKETDKGFGDQLLKISSNSSLVSTVKDSADADVSSLLDIPIQHETPQIQSPSVQKIPVSVIPETTNLPPIPEIVTETPVSTAVPSPQVTPISSSVQQTPTPIPTKPITTDAPTITTVIPESNALSAVELRVAKLEKDMFKLKIVDHTSEALAALQSQVPTVVDSYLDTKVGDVFQKELQKHTADLIHKYSLQHLLELTKKPTPTVEQESEKSPSDILKIKNALYQSMHANKSFNRNLANHRLYHALMEALIEDENAMDKGITDTFKDHKRKQDDDYKDDDDKDPPARPNQGKKTKMIRTKESESSKKPPSTKDTPKGKTPTKGSKTGKSAPAKEPVKKPIAEVIMDDAGDDVAHDDNPPQDTSKPKTRKTLNPVVLDQPTQPWFNQMVSASKDPLTFNDLMATPIDFSKYVLDGLKIDNLTQDILLGPTFNLLLGTCSSSIELEYNFQECFNALTDKLDWNNPKGDRYPFDLSKPLPLQGPLGHRTVAADYFFNNDLEYLKTSNPEVTYTTSIMKTKVARYKIKGIEDMVPTLWGTIKHAYDKDAEKGFKHWGERRKLCYRSQVSKFSKNNVYSTKAILGVKSVSVKKLHGYGHLEEIVVKRSDQQFYKFKEGNFVDLHLNDVEDMLLLVVQHKLFHLDENVIKLNITKPQKTFPEIEFKKPYTPSYDPLRIVYEDLDKQKRVLRDDELYKFSSGTLRFVYDEIHHRVLEFCLDYNTKMPKRKWTAVDRKILGLIIELIDKQLREREIIKNLERLVGARELKMDYKLMTRTV